MEMGSGTVVSSGQEALEEWGVTVGACMCVSLSFSWRDENILEFRQWCLTHNVMNTLKVYGYVTTSH